MAAVENTTPGTWPDSDDLQLADKSLPSLDFNQGQFHNDVARQLKIAREMRLQQNWRSRAGPWQQK